MNRSSIRVLVLNGGYSREREVSLRSGKNVYDALCRLGYDAHRVDPLVQDICECRPTLCFNVLHGTFGEDGGVQALLDHYGIPYVGSGVRTSVLGMNKWLTKTLLIRHDIRTPNGVLVHDDFLLKERLPKSKSFVLKPLSEGSSVDVIIVDSYDELRSHHGFLKDRYGAYLIEEFIAGKEVTVSVIERDSQAVALPILELRPKKRFYDYEAKYTSGMTDFILPADISQSLTTELSELALKVHHLFDCQGFSRTDFLISDNDTPYALELNTLPGMTELSDLPAQAQCAGISFDELVDSLVQSVL